MKKFSLNQSRLGRPFLVATVLASTLIACDKQALAPDFGTQAPNMAVYDDGLDVVAKALAKSLADAQVRTLVKAEASKQVDGDYNILYSTVQNRMVNGQTFEQTLTKAQVGDKSARTTPIEQLSKSMPLLNISVPVNISTWDVNQYSPLVVISTKDDEKAKTLKAYDKDGNIHYLDAKKAPEFPVVVVGKSERYSLATDGQVIMQKGFLPAATPRVKPGNSSSGGGLHWLNDEQSIDDGSGGGGGGGGGGSGGGGSTGTNDCNDMTPLNLYVTGWYSGNISGIESWARGTPEIRMRGFAINQSGTQVPVFGSLEQGNLWVPNSRGDVDAKWWNINDYLFRWNLGSYGEEVTFVIYEQDEGDPTTISIPVSFKSGGFTASTTLSFQIEDGDDYIGYFPRQLPFCSGAEIGTETLKCRVRRSMN